MKIEDTMRSLDARSRHTLIEFLKTELDLALSKLSDTGLSWDDTCVARGRVQYIKMLLNGANSAAQTGR